ncbi:polysaccharide export protein [Psychromonas ingrahamii 37]|uniref:Polysaccharide export protein n=1 Tax=Psychromonas ingrahamii (strain DSM 17664 / CCUG 51855 / 37) TaxID=357804 RepID=A1SSZ6_PSYIN|nr:SLBB domain-containing protein [Psychromonas ingrahamii]ABM02611.1 polysaccharide export protein [Psychromonas ingrahamii 37]
MFNLCLLFSALMLLVGSFNALAATPTSAQIQQFKALPSAQQNALASQYGVNIDAVTAPPAENSATPDAEPTIEDRTTEDPTTTAQKTPRGLKMFGYDLFAGEPMSLAPLSDLPVPNDYLLGVGDELQIKVFGTKTESYNLVINREGSIHIPDLGPFQARGLTYQQLKTEFTALINRRMIGVETSISLGKLKTMEVFVLGAAYKPGSYVISSLSSVTQAIKAAGGIERLGSLREIQVKRNNKIIKKIDLYDLLISGDTSSDISLKQGDVVFIPIKKKTVSIDGFVKRPAIYELKNEKDIDSILKLAGGLNAKAYPGVQVTRRTQIGRDLYNFNLEDKQSSQTFIVENGDQLNVGGVTDLYHNAVSVSGAVSYEGAYQWNADLTVSDLITSIKFDLNKDADLHNALLVREVGLEHNIKVLYFDLLAAISNPKSDLDLKLQAQDQLLILNKETGIAEKLGKKSNLSKQIDNQEVNDQFVISDLGDKSKQQSSAQAFRADLLKPVIAQLKAQSNFENAVQIVDIRGAVKFPGVYPLFEHADLKTLINLAGGLKEASYLTAGELSRIKLIDGKERIHYQTIDIASAMKDTKNGNIKLKSKDRVHVFTKPEWREDYKATLSGEVRFPGTYRFNRGETLYDVIQRAGGLTEYAYPEGAVFARESLRKIEEKQLAFLHRRLKEEVSSLAFRRQSSSNPVQSNNTQSAMDTVEKLGVAEAVGRMSINLKKMLQHDEAQNINLENQDFLHIPPLRKVISVIGHVQFPTAHIFEENKSVDAYLALSGGAKKQADTDRVYVIRANGSVFIPNQSFWFSREEQQLMPGDTIVMPMDTDYMDRLSTLTSSTQIMYQLGVAWSAISN